MLLIEEEKAIFIHVPHAAGTSMKSLLDRHFETEEIGGIHDGVNVLGDKYSDYFKFCIVRNHWDWILSKWCYLVKKEGELNSRIYDFITDTKNSFSDFVAWYLNYKSPSLPQCSGFFNWGGEGMKRLDGFITFDGNCFDGMDRVLENFEIAEYEIPHFNQNHNITRSAIFNRSSVELVRKHYQKEIDFFGFEF